LADERDDIRSRIDIVDLVSQRVSLRKTGKNFTGLCPFHADKNPSFHVDPLSGRYKCFACGESGDIFTWVMKTENLDFSEAIQELARRAGITLSRRSSTANPNERESRRKAMDVALAFFRESLKSNRTALDYCASRDLPREVLDKWELGYAPDAGEALAVTLKRSGVSLAEAKDLFLVDQDASGGYYDRFRGRLVFPIRNEKSELVAFGGRLIGDGHPKYINSSDTALYKKSRVLFGMNFARDAMSKLKTAVLVEGYMDAIACHRSGLAHTVASLGTSLSEDHAKLLKRWVEEVTVFYDSDAAGQKAADRAIQVLQAEGLRVRLSMVSAGKDPDALQRQNGTQAVVETVQGAVTPMDFKLAMLEARLDHAKPEFWSEAIGILADASHELEVERHLMRLAASYPGLKDVSAARASLKKMVEEARGARNGPRPRSGSVRAAPEFVPLKEPLSSAEVVLFCAFHHPGFRRGAWAWIAQKPSILITGIGSALASAIADAFPNGPPEGDTRDWIHLIQPDSMRQAMSDLLTDFRAANLTEQRVIDVLVSLRHEAAKREVRRLKEGVVTPEERQQVLERLRQLNPDTAVNLNEESDDDPYS
jgi:DNA primase